MDKVIELAKKALSQSDAELFEKKLIEDNDLKCNFIIIDAYSNALDALIENAVNDTCDPVVISHFKNVYNLKKAFNKINYND